MVVGVVGNLRGGIYCNERRVDSRVGADIGVAGGNSFGEGGIPPD